jgi:hypothetical protein
MILMTLWGRNKRKGVLALLCTLCFNGKKRRGR